MKIKVGTFDVLDSGSFLIEPGKTVELSFDDSATSLKIALNLLTNPSIKSFESKLRLVDSTKIEIDLINFVSNDNGVSAGGTISPIKLGHFNNRALYYSFIVISGGNGMQPLCNYTFYLGEAEING